MVKNSFPKCKKCKKLSCFLDKKGYLYFSCDATGEILAETNIDNISNVDVFPVVECPKAKNTNDEISNER